MIFIKVVFPQPDGPTIQTNSLFFIEIFIFFNTSTSDLSCTFKKLFFFISISKVKVFYLHIEIFFSNGLTKINSTKIIKSTNTKV